MRDEFRWEDDDMPGLQKWDELKNKIRVFLSKNVRARGGWLRPDLPVPSSLTVMCEFGSLLNFVFLFHCSFASLVEQQKKFTTGVVSVRSALVRIVFGHVYPRLDVNVSKHLNHLLKSPFCVHPKTGKVCIPMDPEDAEGFDVDAVPHVVQLHEELNAAAEQGDLSKSNWQSTSLRPSIEYFKTFVTTLMNANRAENPRSYAKQAANHAQQEVGQ